MAKNFISNKDETVRMFRSNFLEKFSRIHYTVPLYIFIPVILFFLYRSIFEFGLPVLRIIGLIPVGIFIWTLTEYILHRFVFHWMPPGKLGERLHFVFHGVHHDYPSDSKRLVMVPVGSIPLATLFYFRFYGLLGEQNVAPFFFWASFVGYLFYEISH